jgi:hypothetical protein
VLQYIQAGRFSRERSIYMPLTASRLRQDIYRILDQVLETGIPVEIERGGKILKIVPADTSGNSKLAHLEDHAGFLQCDPQELVHLDWSQEWRP